MDTKWRKRANAQKAGVGLHLECVKCLHPIDEPGGLLFGPPDPKDGRCEKLHVCHKCWLCVRATAIN